MWRGHHAVAPGADAGHGALAVARAGARSVVERSFARSPLKLIATRNHGEAAWVFVVSYGGGLVDGDRLALRAGVGEGATLLLSTQGSTKIYRSPRGCAQSLVADVAPGGMLVLLPDPVVCFAGARHEQTIDVTLADGASLLLLDQLASGRSACGERWAFARHASRILVRGPDGELVRDALLLDPAHGPLPPRLGRFESLATLIALGPRAAALAASFLAGASRPARHAETLVAASPIAGGAIARVAATSVERATLAVRALCAGVPALLGDDPFARKF